MADIEHGESLIDTDDSAGSQALRHRPGHPARARGQVKNLLIALQRQHVGQLFRQINADLRGAAVELGRVLRIIEATSVTVPVFVAVLMVMAMIVMLLLVRLVGMPMFAIPFVIVLVPVFVFAFVFVFVCHYFLSPRSYPMFRRLA
jgi:hypothetical protein